ncbi:MAG TPA: WD40 repeat domain-containing protein [Gemmataceae bacterium]|nr:WD40 repeat domain-containing protein [Gemmataceae bacterium]
MSTTEVPPAGIRRFASLEAMKEEHSTLLRLRRAGGYDSDPDTLKQMIREFIDRGRATGALLRGHEERYSAQNLLTYWSNVLSRMEGETPDDELLSYDSSQAPSLNAIPNPYLSLARPTEEAQGRFPGWERLTAEAVSAIDKYRLAAVIGVRGSGRSALVHAGVIPALRSGALDGSSEWIYLPAFAVRSDPMADLVRYLGADDRSGSPTADRVRQLADKRGRPVVVTVERFDELLAGDPGRARAVADALLRLIEPPDGGHRVLLVTDPAGLGRVEALGPLSKRIKSGQVLVTFTAAELRQMVIEPARRVGLQFDDGLVDRLLFDVQGDPAAVALLRFSLIRLWDAREGNRITHQIYDRLGGGRLAVASRAEEVYCERTPEEQVAAKAILLRLIRPEPGAGVSCRRLGLSQVLPSGSADPVAQRVLNQLVSTGLVVRSDAASGPEEYSPVHEALATAWPRFLRWLDEVRERDLWRVRLLTAAEQWHAQGRTSGALWGGPVLHLAREERARLESSGERLDPLEADFLAASERVDWRRRAWRWGGLLFAVASIITIAGLATAYSWSEAAKQKAERDLSDEKQRLEEKGKKLANLRSASWQLQEGARLAAQDHDTAGAFLWYANAWKTFADSADALNDDPVELERLRAGYLLRLGVARRQVPVLVGMAHDKGQSQPARAATAMTSDGRVLLTVGTGSREDGHPLALLWEWSDQDGQWTSRPLGTAPLVSRAPQSVAAHLSPDGRFAVVTLGFATSDGKLEGKLLAWSVPLLSGNKPDLDHDYDGQLAAATFSPDGEHFSILTSSPVSAGRIGRLADQAGIGRVVPTWTSRLDVWQTGDWKPVALAEASWPGRLSQLAFHPKGRRLVAAVASGPKFVQSRLPFGLEWDFDNPQASPRTYRPESSGSLPGLPDSAPTFVTYSPDGSRLFVAVGQGADRGDAWLFLPGRAENPVLVRVKRPVGFAAFSPRGDRLAVVTNDNLVSVWTLPRDPAADIDSRPVVLTGHKAQVFGIDFSADGRYLATASRDRRARIWDAATGAQAHPVLSHSGSVTGIRFTQNGKRKQLLTVSASAVYRWDLVRDESEPEEIRMSSPPPTVAVDPGGRLAAAGGGRPSMPRGTYRSGWARVWDARTGAHRTRELDHADPVRNVAVFAADNGQELLATVADDGVVRLFDVATGKPTWSKKPRVGKAWSVAFGRGARGPLLAVVIRDESGGRGTVYVCPIDANGMVDDKSIAVFTHGAAFTAAVLSPGGDRVAAYTGPDAGGIGVVVVWDVASRKGNALQLRDEDNAHKEAVLHASFNTDGTRLVTTSQDDTAVVWSLPEGTGEVLQGRPDDVIAAHTADVRYAAFNQSGDRVVTAGADRAAILWEWAPDRRAFRPTVVLPHDEAPDWALFGPGGDYVVTAAPGGAVRVWDAKDGRALAARTCPGKLRQVIGGADPKDGHGRVFVVATHNASDPVPGDAGKSPGSDAPRAGTALTAVDWHLAPLVAENPDEQKDLRQLLNAAKVAASRQVTEVGDLVQLTTLGHPEVFDLWSAHRPVRPTAAAGPGR